MSKPAIRRVVLVVLVTAAVGAVLIVVVLANHGWDPLTFATIGPRFEQGDAAAVAGYDGQFAYYIARDPLGAAEKMDEPAYRYRRILYPALAWLLSAGGQAGLLPWALLGINLAASAAATGLLAWLLERHDARGWFAWLLPWSIGGLFALRGNLNEHLSLALALAGLAFLVRERPGLAAVAFALGGLAKEMALLFAVGGVCWLLARRRREAALGLALGSIGPLLVWSGFLPIWLEQPLFPSERTAFEWLPFWGLKSVLSPAELVMTLVWVVLPTAGLMARAAMDLWRWRSSGQAAPGALYAWCVVTNGLFITFAPRASYVDFLAMMRLLLGGIAAGLLWVAAAHRRGLPWLAAVWAPASLLAWMIPGFLLSP